MQQDPVADRRFPPMLRTISAYKQQQSSSLEPAGSLFRINTYTVEMPSLHKKGHLLQKFRRFLFLNINILESSPELLERSKTEQ